MLGVDGFPLETFVDHYHNDDDDGNELNKSCCGKTKKRNKARVIRSALKILSDKAAPKVIRTCILTLMRTTFVR